ncbi:MAG: hypothetical protein A2219_03430 [Elusimicrobia bacterium RIFOXYA2_FULL_50_26]|nr:MAG: hypothetical protein A2219_03430 [Elusimicrobia bacterium RIFOXYA2_FULL_50_26]
MKILLVNPPFLPKFSRSSRSPAVTKSGTIYYPLWLAHAAGLLEKRGHEVMLLDFPAAGRALSDEKERIMEFRPAIVVCDTSTPSIESDVQCLAEIKSWFAAGVSGVLVGTHVSALAEETFALSRAVDVVARGEYDLTLCELADGRCEREAITGISYRSGEKIVRNPDRPYMESLDELPFVSSVYKKHLDINNYFYAHCQNPVISIFAGRGCPNRCFFCVYPQVMFGRRYRHRSAAHLVDELCFIAREFPQVKEVLIDDDNFTADQPFVEEVCDEIVRRGLSVTWTAEARVELAYPVMVKMKRAGCRLLVAGFESGVQQVLDAVNKGTTVARAEQFLRDARRAGLRVHGCFMAGNRGDTRETLNSTLQWAMKQKLDTAQFFPLMVYPGTEAYQWASSNGYISAGSFRDWLTADGMHRCVISSENLAAGELVDFCDHARRKFYLRPRYFLYKLADILRHPSETGRTLIAARKLFSHLFRKHS